MVFRSAPINRGSGFYSHHGFSFGAKLMLATSRVSEPFACRNHRQSVQCISVPNEIKVNPFNRVLYVFRHTLAVRWNEGPSQKRPLVTALELRLWTCLRYQTPISAICLHVLFQGLFACESLRWSLRTAALLRVYCTILTRNEFNG